MKCQQSYLGLNFHQYTRFLTSFTWNVLRYYYYCYCQAWDHGLEYYNIICYFIAAAVYNICVYVCNKCVQDEYTLQDFSYERELLLFIGIIDIR